MNEEDGLQMEATVASQIGRLRAERRRLVSATTEAIVLDVYSRPSPVLFGDLLRRSCRRRRRRRRCRRVRAFVPISVASHGCFGVQETTMLISICVRSYTGIKYFLRRTFHLLRHLLRVS